MTDYSNWEHLVAAQYVTILLKSSYSVPRYDEMNAIVLKSREKLMVSQLAKRFP
jgi:hypothetical protein